MRPEALDCWLHPCRRRLGPPQGACPYPLPATTRPPSGPEVAMEMGLRKWSEILVRSPSQELEGLFEVGCRVGGRSFASTDVLYELVLPFVIHEILSMEDHVHIGGRVRKVRGEKFLCSWICGCVVKVTPRGRADRSGKNAKMSESEIAWPSRPSTSRMTTQPTRHKSITEMVNVMTGRLLKAMHLI